MLRILRRLRQRHLMCSKCPFDLFPIHHLRPRPSLGRIEHYHRPAGPLGALPRLDLPNLLHNPIQRARHHLMHPRRLISLDKIRIPPIPAHQLLQLLLRNPRQHRRIGDLITIEMQNRQHHPIALRIQKLIRMPRRRQRPRLRLAITHHARRNQIRIIHHRPKRVTQRISQLTPLMNRPRRLRRNMTRNSTWK